METNLCIYICNSLVPEVNHLIQSGNYPDVKVKSFPSECNGCVLNNQYIDEMVGEDIDHFSKIIIILSSCRGLKQEPPPSNKKIEIVHLEQCFELLFNLPTIYHYFKQGYYVISNGWLRNYQRHIREWGFDKESARKFFGESIRKILLLDTNLPGDYLPNLEALSDYTGLPYEVLPIGVNYLQRSLDSIIFKWRNKMERSLQNERIAKLTRESADFSLIFTQLKTLINYTDEQLIVNEIINLLNLIIVPEHICYHQFINGIETYSTCTSSTRHDFDPANCLIIDTINQNELLGSFRIYKLRFPQFIAHYNSIGLLISQLGGLSIANARRFKELEDAQQQLAESENLFKAVMVQSPSIIELYDLDGTQINVNHAYEELWGFPASHTVNIFNILKSKEVKQSGLIEYVERAYNGEAVQVPEYLFDSTGKTEGRGKGRTRWLSTRIYPLKNIEDIVTNIIVTHEDVTLKKQAENLLKDSTQKFINLSRSGTEMLNLPTLDAIYNYLTETFHQQYPNAVILFSSVNEAQNCTSLKIITGIQNKLIQQSLKLTGFSFYEKPFNLQPSLKRIFKQGNFHHFKGGLSEFSGPEFPVLAAKAIEKLLGIRQIYTIGINKDDKLYAILHFFNRGKEPIIDNEYIESFVKQAAIVIERKILEELLKDSEEKYRFIAENMSDVIWSLNIENLHFNYISDSVVNLTGYTAEEAMKQTINESLEEKSAQYVINELPNQMADFYSGKRKQPTKTYELQQRRKDGSVIWVEYTTMFRTNSEGNISSILGISRNIDARKKAEIEIKQKNEELSLINVEKDRFFSIIAHDLRSPFSSLVYLAEMMADESNPLTLKEFHKYSKSLYKTASTTYNLLENLLEWSMLQRGITNFNPQPLSINDFFDNCDDAVYELADKKSINIDIPYNTSLTVFADNNMLHTTMRNLVSNAIKFTKPGGSILINVDKTAKNRILFSVKDSGIGMNTEILNNLFRLDKNVSRPGTNNEPSTGLGLILCKEFIEKNGGTIWAESEEGKGSTFFFTLPSFEGQQQN